MKFLFIPILLFALFPTADTASAQTYLFDYFTANDGLPSNWITTVYQDSRGYIWAGGDGGVSVYDGATFKTFGTAEGLPVPQVWLITESRTSPGTMFVGAHNSGLSTLKDALFRTVKLSNTPVSISAIEEDRDGVIWCGTGRGLFRVKNESVSRVRVASDTGSVTLLHQLSDGSMLIAQDSTLVRYVLQTGKLLPISENKMHFVCTFEAPDGSLWLGTAEGAIACIVNDKIAAIKKTSFGELRSVAGDREGNLWFATERGVVKASTENFPESEVVLIASSNGLQEHDINACLIDREDNLWIGGRTKGLAKLSYRNIIRFEFDDLIPDLLNRTAVADRRGHVFLASENGIREIWNEGGWRSFLHRLPVPSPVSPGKNQMIGWTSVGVSSDGLLWACSRGGGVQGYRIEQRKGSYSALTPVYILRSGGELPSGLFVGGLIDHDDQLLLSMRPGTLVQVDLPTRTVRATYDLGVELIGGGTGQALTFASDGTLWVCTFAGGVYVYSRNGDSFTLLKKLTIESGLADNRVRSIVQRRNGEIWIGTRFNGISVYKGGKFRSITMKNGLLNNAVWKMFEDDDGRLWIGTSVGLQYTSRDGDSLFVHPRLSGAHIRGIGQIPGKKILWVVTGSALTVLEYSKEEKSYVPPLIYVSGLRANGIDKDLDSELVLSSAESFCVMRYAGLSFKDERGLRYRHRLIGLDTVWNEPTDQRVVTFGSLASGSYTFEVKATTSDGTESTQPASLSFTILPPWYRSPWTIGLYVLFGSLAVFLYIKVRTRQLEERSIKLEQMVNERTVEVVQQRNRLHEQAEKLREIDSLKSHFFTNISHEFRTPLTVILGHLDRLLKRREGEEVNEFHVMNRNARRLLHLINELLDLSKLEAGAMTLRASKTDIAEFAKRIAVLLDSYAEHKGIRLTLNGDFVADVRGLPAIYAYFDNDKMEKVLYNLLSNALKFTPRGGSVDVSVSTGNSDEQTQCVQIAVSDTGKGISANNLPYVFDRFFQADDSGKSEAGGTGIGLALVKELVELHHGTVNVTSVEGKGTTFTVQLPLGTSHLDEGEIVEGDESLEPPELKAPLEVEDSIVAEAELSEDATRILIVEDNADLRKFIREQLADEYAIIEAANGSDGVKLAEELIPDLVISDIMMPEMDGYQLCAAIKSNEKLNHIPVILLTAKATTENKLEGLEQGADDYLTKPFDSQELRLRARNLIQTRRTLREKFTSEMLLKPSAVTVPSAQKQFLERVTSSIEKHLSEEELSVESLASEVGLSRAQLRRKLKAITNKSPNELIRSFRLQRAAELIRQDAGSLAEIAYQVGFSSQAYFTRCFGEEFGSSPSEYRKSLEVE